MRVSTLAVLGGAFVIAIGLLWIVTAMALEHWMVRWQAPRPLGSDAASRDSFVSTPPHEHVEPAFHE